MIKTTIREYLEGLANLFFPHLCIGCYEKIAPQRTELCIFCEFNIPKTNQYFEKHNKFTERFAGKTTLFTGAAYYHFTKEGHTQKLIHQIKYHGKKEAAVKVGQIFGSKLTDSPLYHDVSVIVPVPMHIVKERIRGYNQADYFAEGLSQSMKIPFEKTALIKQKNTGSQTQRGRIGRIQNVEEVFALGNIPLENKHILLVDDVLTTGATLEACASILLRIPNVKLSMATIAMAGGNY